MHKQEVSPPAQPYRIIAAQHDSTDSDNDPQHQQSYINNPFTKYLMQKLGDKFDHNQFITKNKKMLNNLSMLDGIAFCGVADDYQHCFLDKIKITEDQQAFKPTHIDKLFEKEDNYLYKEEYEDAVEKKFIKNRIKKQNVDNSQSLKSSRARNEVQQ
jgi:hypothetical protein